MSFRSDSLNFLSEESGIPDGGLLRFSVELVGFSPTASRVGFVSLSLVKEP